MEPLLTVGIVFVSVSFYRLLETVLPKIKLKRSVPNNVLPEALNND